MKHSQLVVFPQSYPFQGGDQVFLKNELQFLKNHFKKIYIIHFTEKNTKRIDTPQNVEILILNKQKKISNFQVAFQSGLYELLLSEYKRLSFRVFIKYFKFIFASFKKNWMNVLALNDAKLLDHSILYYSFWMNDAALMLAIAQQKKKISNFIFRLHGFDLYEEIRPDQYIPFRDFNFRYVSKAFTVSKYGYNYLRPKLKLPMKLINGYLGTTDRGINPINNNLHILVSCSSLNINKRVTLIIDSLAQIMDLNIQWFHFGGRGDMKLNKFIDYANHKLSSNIKFFPKGQVDNEELMHFYQTHPVSAFIHLSSTEGGPSIACVEAISHSIPLIATTVGGLKESVTDQSGVPLTENPTINEVVKGIRRILSDEFQNDIFRNGVKSFWKEKFNAEETSRIFINEINSLKK